MMPPTGEGRSLEQLREHYEIETALAQRLRTATKPQRGRLYSAVYDELYRRVPHHPQLTRKADPVAQRQAVATSIRLLERFLRPAVTFMEIGPGDCSLSIEVASRVQKVYAVDVSAEITSKVTLPDNLELIISDGSSIPLAPDSIDLAYSYQLIEHLHPSDAAEHVRHIRDVLAPGGIYVCVTPSRLNGPHDVSKHFDRVATGLHLKEYTTGELAELFAAGGFSTVRPLVGVKGHYLAPPVSIVRWVERALMRAPYPAQARLARWRPLSVLLGVTVVGTK